MGTYDIGNAYTPDVKVSYADLCRELMDEYEKATGKDVQALETYRAKIKNHQKSGLLDKLNRLLGYDIEEAVCTEEEKFALLKLLKELYYIEKSGSPKFKKWEEDLRIQITDILGKPRLENVKTDLSPKSVYGNYFENLFSDISKEVKDADERLKRVDSINDYWEYLTDKIFDYVITEKALDEPDNACIELERMQGYLENRVLKRLSEQEIPHYVDGDIMSSFYNKLICHRMMCKDVDRLNINYQICLSPKPSQDYIDFILRTEGGLLTNELLAAVKNYIISGSTDNAQASDLVNMIIYPLDKECCSAKSLKFAITHYETVLNWWINGRDMDTTEGIAIDTFMAIMQELIVVYATKEGLRNDYYGYNNPNRSLTVAVKKPEEADAVAVQAWIKKLENRAAVNFGAYNLIKKKRDIENCIYKIKKYIYSYSAIDDIVFANDILCKNTAQSIISRELAKKIGNVFATSVCKHLNSSIKDITFLLDNEGINVFNMFRDFTVDRYDIADLVARDFARQINEFYAEKSDVIGKGMACDFEIAVSENRYWDHRVTFYVDRIRNIVEYKQYVEILPDEECERMKQLGLGKFIGDEWLKFF